jgi:hypothetical protein
MATLASTMDAPAKSPKAAYVGTANAVVAGKVAMRNNATGNNSLARKEYK